MGNPDDDDDGTARDRARAVFVDTLVTEGVTLACTAVLFAAVYWRQDLLRLARRLAPALRPAAARPDIVVHALTLAQFRTELSEIDHAPQTPPYVL